MNKQTLFARKYQLKEVLGQGGFATVYNAIDTSLDRQVAIKILDSRLQHDKTFITRFHREAKAVARLQHPHIINVYEVGEYEGQHFIAMPYLPGPNLHDLIRKQGALPFKQVTHFAEQIGSALDYAHKQGIIHRDLKPPNIIFDHNRQAILTDFGIVKMVGEGSTLTATGATIGTPPYMAPEQWTTGQVDARTDIYSFGIVLYQMFTGKVPFQGQTPHQVMYQHLEVPPASPLTINPQLPSHLEPVFNQALAKKPEERYQTALALVTDLKEHRRPTPVMSSPVQNQTPPTVAPTTSSNKLPIFLIGGGIGVLLLCLLILIGSFFMGDDTSEQTIVMDATPTMTIMSEAPIAEVKATSTRAETAPEVETPEAEPTSADVEPTSTRAELPTPVEATPEVEPTSTRAELPTVTPTATSIPTKSPQTQPSPTPTKKVITYDNPASLTLLEPQAEHVFPNGTSRIEFRWEFGNDCQLLPDTGFELRIWRDGTAPAGAMDAVNQQSDIQCNKGTYSFTVGDFQSVPGGGASGNFMWDVILVEIAPYNPTSLAKTTPVNFALGGTGGGDGGSSGSGSGGDSDTR